MTKKLVTTTLAAAALASALHAAPTVQIRLPERFRVLTDQRFDIRIEATDIATVNAGLTLFIDGRNVTNLLGAPEVTTDNDNNPATLDKAWTFRKVTLTKAKTTIISAHVDDGTGSVAADTRVGVQDFRLHGKKNIILFIGDAMGTAYRDLGRLVGQSTGNRFREGFFDNLQEMDKMPACGIAMTYSSDRIVPDSAPTATAWSAGNKTIEGAVGVFPDNNDFRANTSQSRKQYALDNPRVETLWEYLKRIHGYKTGIVTTSDVTDATPAGEGGHTILRALGHDIAKQYVDGGFGDGPTFDVIMGGGKERFDARTLNNSGDTRNLSAELQAQGFTYVTTRTQLNGLPATGAVGGKLLGLFRTGHMNVAYDKLGLVRPADEVSPPFGSPISFGGFNDQPFLDEMTAKAIATLTNQGGPFIIMVEGASVDKQSHSNHAAGQIWDTIELDKSVGVARAFAATTNQTPTNEANNRDDTLVIVTADHDQSIHVLGLVNTANPNATQNVRNQQPFTGLTAEVDGFPDYEDANGDGYPENTNQFRISVGYRTGSHTGSSVPVTAEGPGAVLFTGYYDQTDIFFKMARVLSTDMTPLDQGFEKKKKFDAISQDY
jgi:alkaline phosphatase